jgi:hypothetical protein
MLIALAPTMPAMAWGPQTGPSPGLQVTALFRSPWAVSDPHAVTGNRLADHDAPDAVASGPVR